MSCPDAGGCGQGSRYDLVSNAVVPWLVSFSYKKMVFKHLPLSTQLFTWCIDSLRVSILRAVPSFVEDCLNSSCRSCLLCARAVAHSFQKVSSA